jgi:hypothetical protein
VGGIDWEEERTIVGDAVYELVVVSFLRWRNVDTRVGDAHRV